MVFPVAQSIQRLHLGRVIGTSSRQGDAPSRQEASDTCLPGPAVDVLPVVDDRIERDERGSLGTGSTLHVVIEELLPGSSVDAGRPRDHAIQVEQEGLELRDIDGDDGRLY